MLSGELSERLQTRKISEIIFDFDGTLLDIKKPLRSAIEIVFKAYAVKADINIAMNEIGALLETIQGYPLPKIILQSHELFQYISSLKGISFLKKLRIGTKIFSKYLELSKEAVFFPEVKQLIQKLSKFHNLFIVSHNKTEDILYHLQKEGLDKYFKGIFGSDKLPELKPNPDAFLPVFDMIPDLKSEEAVMIGDMPTDIEAGKEAGFWTIGITSGISKKEILEQYNPDLLLNSLKEILKIFETQVSNVKEKVKIKS